MRRPSSAWRRPCRRDSFRGRIGDQDWSATAARILSRRTATRSSRLRSLDGMFDRAEGNEAGHRFVAKRNGAHVGGQKVASLAVACRDSGASGAPVEPDRLTPLSVEPLHASAGTRPRLENQTVHGKVLSQIRGDGVRLAFEQLDLEGHGEKVMLEALVCGRIDDTWPGGLVSRRLLTAVTRCAVGQCHGRPHTDSIACSHAATTASRRTTLDCRILSDSASSS